MQFMPTIELTPQVRLMLARRALRLQPGQWVRADGRPGRYLRTDPQSGVTYVSWVRPGDNWTDQAQRFHRACYKGFVGKYRPLYDVVKAMRDRQRASREREPLAA